MGRQYITLATGVIVCELGQVERNLTQMEVLAAQAAAAGARVILFAEGALTGYLFTPEGTACAQRADGPAADRLRACARRHQIAIVAGTIERSDAGLHVSQFVALPDGQLLLNRKSNITPTEKAAGIVPGPEERLIFEIDGVRLAALICADSGIPDIWNKLARRGAQVFLASTAGGAGREHMCPEADLANPERRKAYIAAMEKVCFIGGSSEDCYAHRMALVAVNLVSDDGVRNYHPGHTGIIDSRGCVVGLIPGEYVPEWQHPRLLLARVLVQDPCEAPVPPKKA